MGIQIRGSDDNISASDGSLTINGASFSTLQVNGQNLPTAGPLSNRNLVINGAMQVAQRGTSSSSLTSGNNFILDRWRTYIQDIGTYTISQASDAPTGFRYSYKVDCTTADASPSAADDMTFYCNFEGQDFQHLKKGTASAESVTLSFWVKSNKTTTGQVNFRDQDNSRMISGTYTINSADTWEYKTITFVGDTSGVLDNDNAASIQLQWYLDSGSNFTSGSINSSWGSDTAANRNVNNFGLASSTDNYWQITGVQLEVGSVATPFEHRSYGDELARCQRYYGKIRLRNQEWIYNEGNAADNKWHWANIPFTMRTNPSVDVSDLTTGGSVSGLSGTISTFAPQSPGDTPGRISTRVTMSTATGTGRNVYHTDALNSDYIAVSAEL